MTELARERVLVVDDDPAIRALVTKLLDRDNFDVAVARDGRRRFQRSRSTSAMRSSCWTWMAGATSFRRTRTSRPELTGVRGKLLAALLFQQSDVIEDAPFDESGDGKPRSVKYRASQSLQHGNRQLHGDSFPLLA